MQCFLLVLPISTRPSLYKFELALGTTLESREMYAIFNLKIDNEKLTGIHLARVWTTHYWVLGKLVNNLSQCALIKFSWVFKYVQSELWKISFYVYFLTPPSFSETRQCFYTQKSTQNISWYMWSPETLLWYSAAPHFNTKAVGHFPSRCSGP